MSKELKSAAEGIAREKDLMDFLDTSFSDDLLQSILPYTKVMNCPKGMEVIIGGMEADGFYFLKNGTIEVSYQSHDTKIVVALIGPGQFFGESGFFDRTSRVRDIRAVDDAEIYIFDSPNLQALQNKNPFLFGNLIVAVAQSISLKFRRVLEEREPMTVYAASLSTGTRTKSPDETVSADFILSHEGRMVVNMIEDFKSRFFDLSYLLQKDERTEITEDMHQEAAALFDEFSLQLERLNRLDIDQTNLNALWQYVFRETFPYVMRSRVAERSYFKPKGYAGDFLMIEMLYDNKPNGDGKIGKLIDAWCLDSGAARAVRARRKLLAKELTNISRKKLRSSSEINIMNLACGPSRELVDFIKDCEYSNAVNALCIDIDPEALEYTNRNFNSVAHQASISLMRENLIKWSLKRVDHRFEKQDIIYSSGLMDYLDDRLFRAMIQRCYEHLKPGGVLMLGNFSPENPIRMFMDNILDWKLIHRRETDLMELFEDSDFGGDVKVIYEENKVNLFAVATKF